MNISRLPGRKRFIFVSPHLDDAILSAGALIHNLSKSKKVEIITIFTEASKKSTAATGEFVKACHHKESGRLFNDRRAEDAKLCRHLKIGYLHLGFTDALWRDDYRSMKEVFADKMGSSIKEHNLEKSIAKKLIKAIGKENDAVIFAPLSIGNHIDHRIVNKICRDNFTNLIYWEDFPYSLKSSHQEELVKKNSLSCFEFDKDLHVKDGLIRFYSSQIPVLFPDNVIAVKKEKYYFNNLPHRE